MKNLFFLIIFLVLSNISTLSGTINEANLKKTSTESITVFIDSCSSKAEWVGRHYKKNLGEVQISNIKKSYCACMSDQFREGVLSIGKKAQDRASNACFLSVDNAVAKYLKNSKNPKVFNIVNKSKSSSMSIYVNFYKCLAANHKSLECSCIIDYFRETSKDKVISDFSVLPKLYRQKCTQ